MCDEHVDPQPYWTNLLDAWRSRFEDPERLQQAAADYIAVAYPGPPPDTLGGAGEEVDQRVLNGLFAEIEAFFIEYRPDGANPVHGFLEFPTEDPEPVEVDDTVVSGTVHCPFCEQDVRVEWVECPFFYADASTTCPECMRIVTFDEALARDVTPVDHDRWPPSAKIVIAALTQQTAEPSLRELVERVWQNAPPYLVPNPDAKPQGE